MLPMNVAAMAPLKHSEVCYLVYHTAGDPHGGDTSAEAINRYHRTPESKGGPPGGPWAGIGYHYVVRFDGSIEPGRPRNRRGAHVKGLNHCSLGIAFSGNGDTLPLTPEQVESGVALGAQLVKEYRIKLDNVIGHREVNALIERGEVPERDANGITNRTVKSCPGTRVKMTTIRLMLKHSLYPPAPDVVPHRPQPPPMDLVPKPPPR